LDEVKPEGVLK